ncbi:uncharacterized protein L969DRAFT_97087 [Mixia osmundae IAM 14324]|uniref:Actin-crosslinking protein n=1 Tax=Mixia osmundae (strain CBS 9802 / IAM 14324 / JCM 22182 / KY 12970) TaxID=764103 RepID=G7E1M7_MIXOS|nr:uncharacterized protein L969DRAFT_97087 [Mixia osmundae IAM 14324]KEI36687.1 hypothetical protein L969DRAFT_97087 [Mixia osmundae IAM 14324]GAA96737.1 hypothetical protein E5Q_03408 [Mixia osmundae IAM 14324]
MGKLSFKGEPKTKKRKVSAVTEPNEKSVITSKDDEQKEGWMDMPSTYDAIGPLYIINEASQPPTCLAVNVTINQRVHPHALTDSDLHTAEPKDISHVWVCTRIPDSDDKVTLRTSNGRFLAVDEVGVISADREARGLQEEWTLEAAGPEGSGQAAFKGAYGKYLSFDEVAGGKLEIRGDSDTLDAQETLLIRMQAEYRYKRGMLDDKKPRKDGLTVIKDVKGAENSNIMKYQARGAGRLVGTDMSKKELRQARDEGTLHETMLDKRMKIKSDRYC